MYYKSNVSMLNVPTQIIKQGLCNRGSLFLGNTPGNIYILSGIAAATYSQNVKIITCIQRDNEKPNAANVNNW